MEKFHKFIGIVDEIKADIASMQKATTRQAIEELELHTRDNWKHLIMTLPYLEREVHDFALDEVKRIIAADTKASLKR